MNINENQRKSTKINENPLKFYNFIWFFMVFNDFYITDRASLRLIEAWGVKGDFAFSQTLTHPHTLSCAHILTLPRYHIHAFTLFHSHTLTLTLSRSYTLTLTHVHTLTAYVILTLT